MIGNTFYGPIDVARVLVGETVPGASFTVGELRLPRAVMGLLAGFAFGIAGVTFQTMLRNPLASPDIIGISAGASTAAVFGIIVLSLDETAVSFLALLGALLTAAAIYLLSNRRGFAGTRLILIGIGVAAMLHSAITYILSRAAAWDLQTAMQWLTGSLNGATWDAVLPLAVASARPGAAAARAGSRPRRAAARRRCCREPGHCTLGRTRVGPDPLGRRAARLRHRRVRADRVRRVHGRTRSRRASSVPGRRSCCPPASSALCSCSAPI